MIVTLMSKLSNEPLPMNLDQAIDLAESLLDDELAGEALDLLKQYLPGHADHAPLHLAVGRGYYLLGEYWLSLAHHHQAQRLMKAPDFWIALMASYIQLDLSALALDASRRAPPEDLQAALHELGEALKHSGERVRNVADALGLKQRRAEEGLRFFEEGQIALHTSNYSRCINLNRRALQILGLYPPCLNNLSQAQFLDGHPQEAIRSAQQVLELERDNVHALANLIRFLKWTGSPDEARKYWHELRSIDPSDYHQRMKIAEAAALMEDDQRVWDLLQKIPMREPGGRSASLLNQLMLAVSAANLGLAEAADHLRDLSIYYPWAGVLLEAYESGKPGPAWADRYPYFHSSQLLPDEQIHAFLDLLKREPDLSRKRFQSEIERFAKRFPQLVLFAEKTILEDDRPHAGIELLATLGTPEAYQVLHKIGFSKIGPEDMRMNALFALQSAGEIPGDEPVKFWRNGEWRELRLLNYEIGGARELPYSEEVKWLLEKAADANLRGDEEKAIDLYEETLRREPRAKEAYNNLASIYAYRSDHKLAREHYDRALDIDPAYIFARCNKALYLMNDGKLDEAEDLIMPAFERVQMVAEEYTFLTFTRARMHYLLEEYEQSLHLLDMALEVDPDYEPAIDLFEDIEWEVERRVHREGWRQEQIERGRRKRRKLQSTIDSDAPGLEQALNVQTKDSLTEIARTVDLERGWSTLKKAELVRAITNHLSNAASLAEVIDALKPVEKQALTEVMQRDGVMAWEDFDANFGNDLEESQYWRFNPPETVMGRLRLHGLIAEATVHDDLLIVIPFELRSMLAELLSF